MTMTMDAFSSDVPVETASEFIIYCSHCSAILTLCL